jgi:hypothetical protein
VALGLVFLPGRSRSASRTGMYACCLSLNLWPTDTRALSIGVSERRSSAYSLTNVAEFGWPASMRMASSSSEGSVTLSEVWVLGLYQYVRVLLPKRTLVPMYPMLRVRNGCRGSGDSPATSIHPSAWKGNSANFALTEF